MPGMSSTCRSSTSLGWCRGGLNPIRLKKPPARVVATRKTPLVKAAMAPGAELAVAQQAIAFGAVVLAEGLYTRTQIKEGGGGRPQLQIVAISTGMLVLIGILLLSDNGVLEAIALALGLGTTGFLAYNSFSRFQTVESDPLEWPGPRSWPVGMGIASMLVFLACAEGLGQFQ